MLISSSQKYLRDLRRMVLKVFKVIKSPLSFYILLIYTAFLYMYADLLKQTKLCTTPEPNAIVLTEVKNVKSWLTPTLEDIHGHSTPHCFKFIKSCGEVKMFFKHWSKDPWCDESQAVTLLKVCRIHVATVT